MPSKSNSSSNQGKKSAVAYNTMAIVFASMLVWMGCAPTGGRGLSRPDSKKLDMLTSFTLAVSKRDFKTASLLLSPSDRSKVTDAKGEMDPEIRRRLESMRLTTLLNNPVITIRLGKISGIPTLLSKPEESTETPMSANRTGTTP